LWGVRVSKKGGGRMKKGEKREGFMLVVQDTARKKEKEIIPMSLEGKINVHSSGK